MFPNKITSSDFLKLVASDTKSDSKSLKKLRLRNEKNSIKLLLLAMTFSFTSRITTINISTLDLGKLNSDEDENEQAQFLKTFGDHCPKIVHLRLGKACINTKNDSHVKYLCETIEHQLKSLKSLNLSGLNLNDDDACLIIMACDHRSKNCQINYINLSGNELACLEFVIPGGLQKLKKNLMVLNLSKNNLGFAGDPFAKESDALYDTIQTLNTIMLEFPMLSTLKMNKCNFGKYEGIAIAENLVNCTLTKLDLGNNTWEKSIDESVNKSEDESVKEKLTRAWKGPTKGLIC